MQSRLPCRQSRKHLLTGALARQNDGVHFVLRVLRHLAHAPKRRLHVVAAAPGEITLVTLGPLTNIAMALSAAILQAWRATVEDLLAERGIAPEFEAVL
jgi:hypothetical protein